TDGMRAAMSGAGPPELWPSNYERHRLMATSVMTTDSFYTLAISSDARERRQLRGAISSAVDAGEHSIIIDCRDWSQLDLSLLGTLVQGAKLCADRGVEFTLTNLSATMRSTIQSLRLEKHLGLDAE